MMELDEQQLRLEGIYKQNDRGAYMQRVKLPGGILSVAQAEVLAGLGECFGSGVFHLSTRGSLEFHGLQAVDLSEVHRGLSSVGLFSRGACGGAVRGISCSSSYGPGFSRTQVVLRHFLHHFSGNPHFEGLPKKFKIAVEAGYERSRHLIQDLGLVLVEEAGEKSRYDLWIAGGLGREPQAGFLLADRVVEDEILPLTEAIVEVYKEGAAKGRRLKHLLNEIGEQVLRERIVERRRQKMPVAFRDAFPKAQLPPEGCQRLQLRIFAGELSASRLASVVASAKRHACQWLLVTPDQDLELLLDNYSAELEQELEVLGFDLAADPGALRVCPGNHECRMGLFATRELARSLQAKFAKQLQTRTLAISGCRNSCAQPQLAEFGILAGKLKSQGGQRVPLYDLYRKQSAGLGQKIAAELTEAELLALLEQLLGGG
jgi:sulfite reductase beta subunit-like hemoprotein